MWDTTNVAGLSLRSTGFDPRPNNVGFLADRLTLENFFLIIYCFPVSIIPPVFHTHSLIIYLFIHSLIYHQRYVTAATESVFK